MVSKTLTLRIEDQKIIDSIEFLKIRYSEKTDSKAIFKHLLNAKKFKKQAEDLSDAYDLLAERFDVLEQALLDQRDAQKRIDSVLSGDAVSFIPKG